MATKVYDSETINLIDGTEVYLTPLKIKHLRKFMDAFEMIRFAKNDEESIRVLSLCALVAIKPYYPIIENIEDLEDSVDLPTVYKILEVTAGININESSEDPVQKQATDSSKSSWEELDLAELEAEVFLLGIWKDYEQLESSLSMPELLATLASKRELDYQEKKFLAAIQGVDLDKQSGKNQANAWEEMKARVFSGNKTNDPNDIVSFQGAKAAKAGFGVGSGLGYEDLTKK
jgi:hypothetical protein